MFLALGEIRRAKWRFALLVGAVGLLVFLILFVQALTGALIGQFIGAIDNQSGEVLVYSEQARKNLEGSIVPPETVAKVAAIDGVGAAGPLGEGTFTVQANDKLGDAVLIGFEPGKPGAPTTLAKGRLPETNFEAVASSRNASEGFAIGDRVRLAKGGREITIVGEATDINYSVLPTMFTTFATYQAARKDANPNARAVWPAAVAATTKPGATAAAVARRINGEISGVEALTRRDAVKKSPGVASVSESLGAVVLLCFFVVVVVAGLFFLILTVQKAAALTLLRAIGIRAGALARSLLVQVVFVVIGGIIVGALFAEAALAASNANLGASLSAKSVGQTGVIVLVLAVIASLAAIRRVLAIDPIRATVPGGIE